MAESTAEIVFGIGTMLGDGGPATAVVVNDQVAPLADIVARHATPGAAAPLMRDFMPDWFRWHDWLRALDLDPSADDWWRPIDSVKFTAPVPEPWNIFQTYHNFERPSCITGKSDLPKAERLLPDMFMASRSSLGGHGDLIITGSPEELPLPPGEKKGLRNGQVVVCEVENLGRLENTIAEQTERQPNEPADAGLAVHSVLIHPGRNN